MKKRLRQHIPKVRSKRGMTLVEILVGVTIVVIVFGATLGAMTHGYSSTLYRADEEKEATVSASMNEEIMATVRDLNFGDAGAFNDYCFNGHNPNTDVSNAIHAAAKSAGGENVKYVDPGQFPKKSEGTQYTLNPNYSKQIDGTSAIIKGIEIKTATYSANGVCICKGFVPYSSQG